LSEKRREISDFKGSQCGFDFSMETKMTFVIEMTKRVNAQVTMNVSDASASA
jgi:hypothetical protein